MDIGAIEIDLLFSVPSSINTFPKYVFSITMRTKRFKNMQIYYVRIYFFKSLRMCNRYQTNSWDTNKNIQLFT